MPIDTLCFLNHRCVNVQLLTLKDTILPRRIKYSFVQLYNVAFELPRIMKPCDRDELFCVQIAQWEALDEIKLTFSSAI